MGPRAGERDVEVIAVPLGAETAAARRSRRAVARDPVAKLRFAAHEPAFRRCGVVPDVVPLAVDEDSHRYLRACGHDTVRVRGPRTDAQEEKMWSARSMATFE